MRRKCHLLFYALFLICFFAQELKSQDVFDGASPTVIESARDDRSGSTLREAIERYNNERVPGVITFKEDFPDVILLEEEIKINVSLLIQGPEKGLTIKVKNGLPEDPGSEPGESHPVSDYRLFKIEPPQGPVYSYDAPIEVRFHNLNLIGGDMEDEDGGAIHYEAYQTQDGNKLLLENVSVSNSKAHYGGAVYIDGYIELEISNAIYKNNYSEKGGAVYFAGTSLVITNSEFEGNRAILSWSNEAYDEAVGGALFISPSEEDHDVIIEDTRFLENSALSGGAIGYNSYTEHAFKIVNTKFIHNKAVYYGGGIYIPYSAADIIIEACEFMHNKLCYWIDTEPGYSPGYGIYKGGAAMIRSHSLDKPVKIHQCEFEGNGIDVLWDGFAEEWYAPQVNGGAISLDAFAFITHTTFKENYIDAIVKVPVSGGGALFIEESQFQTFIRECDFISNYAKLSGPNVHNSGGGAILSTVLPGYVGIMVERSTFSDNYVFINSFEDEMVPSLNGGGACYIASTFILSESTLEGNYVKITGDDELNMNPSGGGAIILGGHGEQSRIVNTTIANNRLENPISEGAGIRGNQYAWFNISNSIILGNYKGNNPTGSNIEFQDIYTIPEDFTMLYSVYGVYQPDVEDEEEEESDEEEEINEEEERKLLHNQISDVQDVFHAEWRLLNGRYVLVNRETGQSVLQGRVMKISAEGAAVTAGTLTAFLFPEDPEEIFPVDAAFRDRKGLDQWRRALDESWVDLFFNIEDEENYGLHMEYSGTVPAINKIAQNQVSRVDQHDFYNAGAYALGNEPEEESRPDFQWSVSTRGSEPDHFYEVVNNSFTEVKEGTPVYLQVRPVISNTSYDKWRIEYEAVPTDYYYGMSTQPKDIHYKFNQGNPHVKLGIYTYRVKELYLYEGSRLVKEYAFNGTSYAYTVIIEEGEEEEEGEAGGNSPDPEPEPNQGPAINIKEIAPFCYNEGEFRIPFERLDVENKLEYRILFSTQAQLAGLEDVSEYALLPRLYVTVPVEHPIPKGTYEGTIYIRINGDDDLVQSYPFELEVKEMTQIIHQPEGVVNLCEGDGFRLSVEAVGDELSYQWYHNDQPIPGANQPTYEVPATDDTVGSYYVEVKGFCNEEISEKVSVLMKQFHIYMKWEDTMAVLDPENQYTSYQWYKDGQPVSVHGSSVYYTDANGLEGAYFVRAYKPDNTYDESCPMLFETNIRSLATSVYPSVVDKGQLVTVRIGTEPEEAAGAYIRIHDYSGRIVLHTRVVEPVIPLYAPAVSGAYLVTISLENGKVFTHKILVK